MKQLLSIPGRVRTCNCSSMERLDSHWCQDPLSLNENRVFTNDFSGYGSGIQRASSNVDLGQILDRGRE